MPRIKASPKKCIKTNIQTPTNSWVFLMNANMFELSDQYTGTGTPDIVHLRHPNSGDPAVFLFSPANDSVQEVITQTDNHRSWFIDETVKSDGRLYLSTPVDPIFLVLPYLKKFCIEYAIPLNQLLIDEEYPETSRLLKSNGLKGLHIVADQKGDDEYNAYKYNEEKTLLWLKRKTERVASILQQKKIHLNSNGTILASATFVKSTHHNNTDPEDNLCFIRYAHGIVSEYLPDDLSHKLRKYLNLPSLELPEKKETCTTTPAVKRKFNGLTPMPPSTQFGDSVVKKSKNNDGSIGSSYSSILDLSQQLSHQQSTDSTCGTAKKNNAKEKARMKAASMSQNINSFFKKM